MNIYIVTNHNKHNPNILLAMKEYAKRLSPYCNIQLSTINNYFLNNSPDALGKIHGHYTILVNSSSNTITSEELATTISNTMNNYSNIAFFLETSQSIFYNQILSISNLSLSADISTVLLYEQIYRGYMINAGRTYHK